MTPYAELHCLSNFTFLRGASHPEELIVRAAALGYTALALTDECSVAGVVRAHAAAKDLDIHLIIARQIGDLEPEKQKRVLSQNCIDLYGLDIKL